MVSASSPLPRRGLAGDERAAAERLIALCNAHEGLDLPIPLDAQSPLPDAADQLLAYDGDELIGVAGLQDGPDEAELCMAVHPAHRRRGVGRALLAAAQAECRRRELPMLLVCDEAAASGRAFAQACGARLHHGEHRLRLDPALVDRSRPRPDGFHTRPAGPADRETLELLQAAAFGDTPAESRVYIALGLADPTRQYWIGELRGAPIGLLRLGRYETLADITAFGVLAEHRGRGYGRSMLLDAVDTLLAEGRAPILIEVFTDNDGAFGLYESCGFRVTSSYAFYSFAQ